MKCHGLATPLFLIAVACFCAGSWVCAETSTTQPATSPRRAIRVACIGDSITFGLGLDDRSTQSYPARLQALLTERGDAEWEVRNFGVSGASALKASQRPYWKTRPFALAKAFEPDTVVIKLGTNDANPANWKHRQDFKADLTALVEEFRSLPSRPRIWLCHPVPIFPGQYESRNRTLRDEVIPVIDQVAKEQKLPVIDLYSALSGQAALFPDTVHPNSDGARLIAKEVFLALMQKAVTAPATEATSPAASP